MVQHAGDSYFYLSPLSSKGLLFSSEFKLTLFAHGMYISGYSNGILRDADDATINWGGQCELGIGMIFVIGEVAQSSLPTPPSTPPTPDVSQVPGKHKIKYP